MKFKVGDKVKIISSKLIMGGDHPYSQGMKSEYGDESDKFLETDLELIEENKINQIKMNIKEKFVLALTPEPKKSFRKVGITNGDDLLTDEGQKIFLTWLLHNKFSDEFKKDVVDPLLAEKDEK